MHQFHCLLLFSCSYFTVVVSICFTGQVKSLYSLTYKYDNIITDNSYVNTCSIYYKITDGSRKKFQLKIHVRVLPLRHRLDKGIGKTLGAHLRLSKFTLVSKIIPQLTFFGGGAACAQNQIRLIQIVCCPVQCVCP